MLSQQSEYCSSTYVQVSKWIAASMLKFEKVGHIITDGMVGKTTFDYSLAGSEKARTMTCASNVKTKDGT